MKFITVIQKNSVLFHAFQIYIKRFEKLSFLCIGAYNIWEYNNKINNQINRQQHKANIKLALKSTGTSANIVI